MRWTVLGILAVCAASAWADQPAVRAHDFRIAEQPGAVERSGRLLVKLKPSEGAARTRALTRIAPNAMDEPSKSLWSLRLPRGMTEEQYADRLMATGAYAWAEPDWRVLPAAVPDDPRFGEQYHHRADIMNTVGAWNMVRGDASITVAVVDTGLDRSHPDLAGALPGYNAIDRLTEAQGGDVSPITSHGTWVMGALGARGNNATGVTGAGWGFSLLPVRASNEPDGSALTSELVHAATWAADHGADIINVSYDGSSASAVGDLGDTLRARGVLLVWAAGNSGGPLVTQDWPGVTIVGATNRSNRVWGSSNYGVGIDLVAPGEVILTTDVGGGYRQISGTSFSAPLVAGVLGLVWSADPSLTADQVEQVLIDTATDMGSAGRDVTSGWGRVNAGAAVGSVFTGTVRLAVPFTEPFDAALDPVVWPTQTNISITGEAAEEPTADASARIDPGGSIVTERLGAAQAAGLSVRWYDSAPAALGPARTQLTVRYTDAGGTWHELIRVFDETFEVSRFGWHAAMLPADAWHDDLRLSLSVPSWSGPVYVDSLAVEAPRGIDPPWHESFDAAAGSPAFTLLNGAARITGVPTASGLGALRLPDGASVESLPVITLIKWGFTGVTDARLGAWVRPVSGVGSLVVETEGFGGTWSQVASVPAAGRDPGRVTRWEIPLPGSMLIPGDTRLRLRALGGTWDLDDLFVTRGSPIAADPCPADLNGDGIADLADVTAFVAMYLGQEPGADVDQSGVVDADDVSGFIQVFLSGCGP
ncbi:MAG: subtilisin family serine protease [Phycisphaerales bacterium]